MINFLKNLIYNQDILEKYEVEKLKNKIDVELELLTQNKDAISKLESIKGVGVIRNNNGVVTSIVCGGRRFSNEEKEEVNYLSKLINI